MECDCHTSFVNGVVTGLFTGLAGGVIIAGFGAWAYERLLHRQFFSSIPRHDEHYRLRSPQEPPSDGG